MIFSNQEGIAEIAPIVARKDNKNKFKALKAENNIRKKEFLESVFHSENMVKIEEELKKIKDRISDLEWESFESMETFDIESLKSKKAELESLRQTILDENGYCDDNLTFHISRPLTEKDIEDIQTYFQNVLEKKYVEDFHITIVLDNTKGQDPNIIKKLAELDVPIIFNVMGGMNRNKKSKFNTPEYLNRTTYSPSELYDNILAIERIESLIDSSWTEKQKALFVYMAFMREFKYDYEDKSSRSLSDIRTKKSVCAGFALMYKEIMDRLGIECEYQNSAHHHDWNILCFDGKHYAIDLTWDIDVNGSNKNNPNLSYYCINSTEQFYGNEHHQFEKEDTDEVKYDLSQMSIEEIMSDREVVSSRLKQLPALFEYKASNLDGSPIYRENDWQAGKIDLSNGISYSILDNEIENEFMTVLVEFNIPETNRKHKRVFYVANDLSLDNVLNSFTIEKAIRTNDYFLGDHKKPIRAKTTTREDGSTCYITDSPVGGIYGNNYCVFDISANQAGRSVIETYRIMTEENNLTGENTPEVDSNIANILLSKEHLKKRIAFMGYIGKLSGKEVETKFAVEADLNPSLASKIKKALEESKQKTQGNQNITRSSLNVQEQEDEILIDEII